MQSVSDVDSLLLTGSVDRHSSLRALSALSDWLVSESAPGRQQRPSHDLQGGKQRR